MSRWGDAWAALRGKGAPGQFFGDPKTVGAVEGLIGGAVPFGSPPKRGERELMVASKKHPVLHSITRRIGYDIGAVPWRLFVATGKDGSAEKRHALKRGTHKQRSAMRTKAANTAELRDDVRELTDHPLLDLLHRFNPAMPGYMGFSIMQTYIDLKGEAFLGIERNGLGVPVQLWPIPGYWIFRTPYAGSPSFHANFGSWVADIAEEDMLWPKHMDPENPYWRGNGTAEALGDEIEIDEYAAKVQKEFFYSQSIPAGIVTVEGLNQASLDQTRERFAQSHVGMWNAMRLFWTGAKIDFKQFSPTFADQKIMELRKDERDKIVSTFGVPPEILGILDHSNRATIAEARPIYAELVLGPRLEFLRNFFQERLCPEFDEKLIIDYVDPTPDDNAFKLQVASAAPWSRSKNEWRELQSLPPVDGGDTMFPPMPAAKPEGGGAGGGGLPPLPGGKGADPAWALELTRARRKAEEDDTLSLRDVLGALDPSALTEEVAPVTGAEAKRWFETESAKLGVEVDWAAVNPLIARHIQEQAGDRIADMVNETTKQDLRDELEEGIEAGEGIDKLALRVGEVFDEADSTRAEAIARTEVCRSSNWATTESFRASGVVEQREWVATPDDRTRDSHAELDGQVVGLDEEFHTSDGASCDHPGDFGEPEEDINCRCTTVAVIKDPGAEDDDKRAPRGTTKTIRLAEWKLFDKRVRPWEATMVSALRRGFKRQRTEVLAALARLNRVG